MSTRHHCLMVTPLSRSLQNRKQTLHSHCGSDQTKSICKAHSTAVETMPETGKFEPLVVQIRRFHEMFVARCRLPRHLKLYRPPLAAPSSAPLDFVSSGANVPSTLTSASSLTTTRTGTSASRTHLWQILDASDWFILWSLIILAAAASSSFLFSLWQALRFFDSGTNAPTACQLRPTFSIFENSQHEFESSKPEKTSRSVMIHRFKSLRPFVASVVPFILVLCTLNLQMPPVPVGHYIADLRMHFSRAHVIDNAGIVQFGRSIEARILLKATERSG